MFDWISKAFRKIPEKELPASSQITFALICGFSVGFSDIVLSSLNQFAGFHSLAALLEPLAATSLVFFVAYLLVWNCVLAPAVRLWGLSPLPLALALGVSLFLMMLLASLGNFTEIALKPAALLGLFGLFSFILAIPLSAYFWMRKRLQESALDRGLPVKWLWLPGVLGLIALVNSQLQFGIHWSLLFFFLLICAAMAFALARRLASPAVLLGSLLAVLVVSPLILGYFEKKAPTSSDRDGQARFKIKHVILLTVDTLRADALSPYNEARTTTPQIGRLAEDSLVFTRAFSAAPWTLPAFASIMSGLSPWVHLAMHSDSTVPGEVKTIAEYLREFGYLTAAIGDNINLRPENHLSQGFSEYNFYPKASKVSFGGKLIGAFAELFGSSVGISTAELTDLANSWLEGHREDPYFFWLHYFDPHAPYAPPRRYLGDLEPPESMGYSYPKLVKIRGGDFAPSALEREWLKTLYEAEVDYVDENIGRFLDTLKEQGIYDEALIIFTSDHGEEFWDHDAVEHGHTVYRELIWVPLMIKLPGSVQVGRMDRWNVTTQSILATILDLCGIEYDEETLSSTSLTPLWTGAGDAFEEQPIISTGTKFYENLESVIFEDKKYIRSMVSGREKLFDLVKDPGEQYSIAHLEPELSARARHLSELHSARAAELRAHYGIDDADSFRTELDEQTKERLRSLGYLR